MKLSEYIVPIRVVTLLVALFAWNEGTYGSFSTRGTGNADGSIVDRLDYSSTGDFAGTVSGLGGAGLSRLGQPATAAATQAGTNAVRVRVLSNIAESQSARAASRFETFATGIRNPIPSRLARVIPGRGPFPTLGPPAATDVFVTAAEDIAGLSVSQIARRLGIRSSEQFTIIEFPTPATGLASPVLRGNPAFIGGGRTIGGAREFVILNGPVPSNAVIRVVGP